MFVIARSDTTPLQYMYKDAVTETVTWTYSLARATYFGLRGIASHWQPGESMRILSPDDYQGNEDVVLKFESQLRAWRRKRKPLAAGNVDAGYIANMRTTARSDFLYAHKLSDDQPATLIKKLRVSKSEVKPHVEHFALWAYDQLALDYNLDSGLMYTNIGRNETSGFVIAGCGHELMNAYLGWGDGKLTLRREPPYAVKFRNLRTAQAVCRDINTVAQAACLEDVFIVLRYCGDSRDRTRYWFLPHDAREDDSVVQPGWRQYEKDEPRPAFRVGDYITTRGNVTIIKEVIATVRSLLICVPVDHLKGHCADDDAALGRAITITGPMMVHAAKLNGRGAEELPPNYRAISLESEL
jgi:hypothetical protein